MDFSLTHLIVVPSTGGTATTGSTQDLTPGKVGVFRNDYTVATAANAAASPYLYIGQGRFEKSLPTLLSDKIDKNKLIYWTKSTGTANFANQITDVSAFSVKCGEDVSLTVRIDSYYVRAGFYNGLTRSLIVKAPCCDCGAPPCVVVDNEKMIDLFIEAASRDFSTGRQSVNLTQFLTFSKIGTGATAKLRISAKDNVSFAPFCGDTAANSYQYDRVSFKTFVQSGPDTMSDFVVTDRCVNKALVTVVQRASYPKYTPAEIRQLEYDYYSYKVSSFKELYRNAGYNPLFESFVENGVVYDQYLIQFYQYDQIMSFNPESVQDERVLLFVPNTVTDIVAILVAAFGPPKDNSSTAVVTTTTTSTTTTSTSTTTTLIP